MTSSSCFGSCDHQLRKSFLTSMATFKKTRGMHTKAGCWADRLLMQVEADGR